MVADRDLWRGDGGGRRDLHNCNVDASTALAGRCGTADLRTGRVCQHLARHPGPCGFDRPHHSLTAAADDAW